MVSVPRIYHSARCLLTVRISTAPDHTTTREFQALELFDAPFPIVGRLNGFPFTRRRACDTIVARGESFMEYDKDKVDEMTLALLFLVMSRTQNGGRALKGLDLSTLERLHQKGWIAEPRIKDMALSVTPEGMKKSEEFFRSYFEKK